MPKCKNPQTTDRPISVQSSHQTSNISTPCRNHVVRSLTAANTSVISHQSSVSLRAATNIDWFGLLVLVYLLVHGKVGPLTLVCVSCV